MLSIADWCWNEGCTSSNSIFTNSTWGLMKHKKQDIILTMDKREQPPQSFAFDSGSFLFPKKPSKNHKYCHYPLRIHGTIVYIPITWMVDFYGKLGGKYTNHPTGIRNVRWTGMTPQFPSEDLTKWYQNRVKKRKMAFLGAKQKLTWQCWGNGGNGGWVGFRCMFCWLEFFVRLEGILKEVDVDGFFGGVLFGDERIWEDEILKNNPGSQCHLQYSVNFWAGRWHHFSPRPSVFMKQTSGLMKFRIWFWYCDTDMWCWCNFVGHIVDMRWYMSSISFLIFYILSVQLLPGMLYSSPLKSCLPVPSVPCIFPVAFCCQAWGFDSMSNLAGALRGKELVVVS